MQNNFNLVGTITTTSNKTDKYKTSEPRKTAYITLTDESKKVAEKNGLTEYTSKDEESFYIIKLSSNVKVYKGTKFAKLDCSINKPNFKTTDNVGLAVFQSEKDGQKYNRIYALNVNDYTVIEEIKQDNPFTNEEVTEEIGVYVTENNDDEFFKDDGGVLEF